MPVQVASHRRKNPTFDQLKAVFPAVRDMYGVKRIGIFGSFARGEQTRKSDVDVIVEFIPGHETFKNFIHLVDFLEALFHRNVDLLTEPSLSELIRPYIEKDVIWIEG
ncbi:MAG: nucleotidyltransferase family protein [Methanomicrobiales archaeon]|nr:nucleotidyltransferase family protein [Methanomicrobiales archaeon]